MYFYGCVICLIAETTMEVLGDLRFFSVSNFNSGVDPAKNSENFCLLQLADFTEKYSADLYKTYTNGLTNGK